MKLFKDNNYNDLLIQKNILQILTDIKNNYEKQNLYKKYKKNHLNFNNKFQVSNNVFNEQIIKNFNDKTCYENTEFDLEKIGKKLVPGLFNKEKYIKDDKDCSTRKSSSSSKNDGANYSENYFLNNNNSSQKATQNLALNYYSSFFQNNI